MPLHHPTDNPATTEADIHALAARLRAAGACRVATVRTHISWLLMAGDTVWKFKQPVRLPFADFSTLALRKHFCEEELRLNRRLAPGLYGGVQPLWRDANGRLSFDETQGAKPAEWAVRMRRFPDDALLATRVARGAIGAQAMHALGVFLGDFHKAGGPAPDADFASPALIRREVLALFEPLAQGAFADRVPRWRAWVDAQCTRLHALWRQRHARGMVREGHGDLHLGNLVCIGQTEEGEGEGAAVVPFDCLEFQPAMRWIDPVNDVAFLTMDLHAHGRADLAAQVMDGWLQQTGDFEGLATWRFYEVYRALVRCMVAGLPSGDARVGRRYADLLDRWTAPPAGPRPPLLITCGASGSGKSTVAAEVMVRLGAVRVRSDVERKRLFGLDALADSHASGLRIYTPEASGQTFARLAGLARGVLQAGWPVVVDAAFLHQAQRAPFARLAAELGAPFRILLCDAPPDTLRERIAARRTHGRDASEATPALIAQQLQALEPLTAEEETHALRIDTRQAAWRERIAAALSPGGPAREGRDFDHCAASSD